MLNALQYTEQLFTAKNSLAQNEAGPEAEKPRKHLGIALLVLVCSTLLSSLREPVHFLQKLVDRHSQNSCSLPNGPPSSCLFFILKNIFLLTGFKERGRERNMDLLFHPSMHLLVDSCICPDLGSNLQP